MERELFRRYKGNPILTPKMWPFLVGAVFNPGAIKFEDKILLLVRVESREGYSYLTVVRSEDGRTNWKIDPKPTLKANINFGEHKRGFEDARIIWFSERQEFIICCVSFRADVTEQPPSISLIATKNFSDFKRISRPLIPPNKDVCLLPETFGGNYALIHRPIVDGRADIWISFSPDLEFWGKNEVLLPAKEQGWDTHRVGLGPPPIKTSEGWLIIYHGARDTASGALYRVGLALLDLERPEKVIRRSKEWVLKPEKYYEMVGDVDAILFPCGAIVDKEKNELLVYYGAADSVICLATANLDEVLKYLMKCPEK